jgi:hypothetical protein
VQGEKAEEAEELAVVEEVKGNIVGGRNDREEPTERQTASRCANRSLLYLQSN